MLSKTLFAVFLIVPANAEIEQKPADQRFDRRLGSHAGIVPTMSHVNDTDLDCVIGGHNPAAPTRVYVGGPCSAMTSNSSVGSDFRYVEMYTFYSEIVDGHGIPFKFTQTGTGVMHSLSQASYAEVAVGDNFKFEDPILPNARFHSSTTSYLAKQTINFNKINFVVGRAASGYLNTIEQVCSIKCCSNPPCNCQRTCPTANSTAYAGDYKYSVFAASYDATTETGYSYSSSTGNGWQRAVSKLGKGTPKRLTGVYNVYQAIDFTQMQSDDVTVTASDGSEENYGNMTACSYAQLHNCTFYSVLSMTLRADNWDGLSYAFPQNYNRGWWSKDANGTVITTPADTLKSRIRCVKPDAAWMNMINLPPASKVLFIEYSFDITGIDADNSTGKYIIYDPTVNNAGGPGAASALARARNSGPVTTTSTPPAGPGTTSGSASHGLFVIQLVLWLAAWLSVKS